MNQKKGHILFLIVICYFSFFINNQLIFADIMESRNLVTAREITEEGNWLVPTMNGELRLEKPPLPTWVAACIELVSPDNLPLQRAAAGVMATLLVFFLYAFASRQTSNPLFGLISAVSLCTSFNIILMGRTATWDIYCHSFMLGAIYFLFSAGGKTGKCWKEFIWAGVFMGLSFLGKGPVSFYALLLPFLMAWGIVYRPSFRGKVFPLFSMVGICLLISLWWPILLFLTHKDMLLSVWNKESSAWLEHSVRPWYYYWKFFTESGVWSLFLVTALIWPYWKKRIRFRKEYLFAVCWVFMVLICLSLLPEKKTRYLLPILIPSALVIAHFFMYCRQCVENRRFSGMDKLLWRVNTLLVAGIVGLLPVGIYFFFYTTEGMSLGFFIFLIFILEGIAVYLFYTALKNKILSYLGGILGLFLSVEIFILPAIVGLFTNPAVNSISAVRNLPEINQLAFYYPCDEGLRIELVYEARRKILPYCFRENEDLPQLPFVLISQKTAEEVLPPNLLEYVELQFIDEFDDNKRPVDSGFHSTMFVRKATLVKAK